MSLGPYVTMEMWREVTTIVMLASVGWLAGRRRADRLAYGLFAFGLWDIIANHNAQDGFVLTVRLVLPG